MANKIDAQDPENMEKKANELIHKMITEGKSLKEASGISDSLLEEIYNLAYLYYDQGKYKESLSLFHFLASISPREYKYSLGLGASYHQLEDYENAALGFFLAFHLDLQTPIPSYYVADCFLKLNKIEQADEFLSLAIEIAAEKDEFASLKERCFLIKKSLNDKK